MFRSNLLAESGFRVVGIVTLIFAAAALRLLPHPWNFSPITAMALFGGAVLSRRWMGIALPLAALLVSDLVLGFHDQLGTVYGSVALVSLIGTWSGSRHASRIATGSLAGSVVFFVVTNLGVWAQSGMYAHTWDGLAACFVAALPFFQNSVVGDLFYSAVIFGAWALAQKAVPRLAKA